MTAMAKSKDVHAATPMLPDAVLDVIIFINPSLSTKLWLPDIFGQYSAIAIPPKHC
jgi:hypothetical protein